jgi:hypothetical protein
MVHATCVVGDEAAYSGDVPDWVRFSSLVEDIAGETDQLSFTFGQ